MRITMSFYAKKANLRDQYHPDNPLAAINKYDPSVSFGPLE
jgi:hypothetical protein